VSAFLQQVVYGVLVGGLYGLAAAGLSLVFGVLKILNVAHGELLMLGGYATFWMFTLAGLDPFLSLLITWPLLFAVGVLLYGGLFRFVAAADEETRIKNSVLIGFGLALALHNVAILLWTADERGVTTDYSGSVYRLAGLAFPLTRVATLVLAGFMIWALHAFLTRTYAGKAIRATAADWEAGALVGINLNRTYRLAFALGCGAAGVAGTLVSVVYSISPNIGLEWTLKALIVVVLAGLGSMPGTFAGGIILGVTESASTVVIGAPYKEVVGLFLFLAVLLWKPQGLFAR
jgi:branched-chain amino acid transport system permease protein